MSENNNNLLMKSIEIIKKNKNILIVSIVSLWEIGIKLNLEKLKMNIFFDFLVLL